MLYLLVCFAVTSYLAGLSLLLCFAYPTPEVPTPSFEYHTAFTGVAFGIVSIFHHSLINTHTLAINKDVAYSHRHTIAT